MSLEILDQLEEKIKQAVETIQLLQLEVEEVYYTHLTLPTNRIGCT